MSSQKPSPIFIIGNPRSGTTLFRLMLTCHPDIDVPSESGWMIELYKKYRNVLIDQENLATFINDLLSTSKIEEWNIDRKDIRDFLITKMPADYATTCSHIREWLVQKQGKIRWGDKNNFYLNHIDTLSRLFPHSQFIHIVRDGRDVACSYKDTSQLNEKYAPSLPATIGEAAYDWKKNIDKIEASFKKLAINQQLTIRYEDLVNFPEETLKLVAKFLEVRFDERMLKFDEVNRKEKLEPDTFMAWKTLTKKPVTNKRVGRWKQEMSVKEKLIFQVIAGAILTKFHYETSSASSLHGFLYIHAIWGMICWYWHKTWQKVKRLLAFLTEN